MSRAGLTAVVVIGSGAILYLIAYLLGLPDEARSGLAGVPAIFIKDIYEFLERRGSQKRLTTDPGRWLPPSIGIPPWYALALGSLMYAGVVAFSGGLMGALIAVAGLFAGQPVQALTIGFAALVAFTAMPIRFVAAVLLGRWLGQRAGGSAAVIVAVAIVVGISIGFLGVLFLSDAEYRSAFARDKTVAGLFSQYATVLPDSLLYCIGGWIGVWRGRRAQQAKYVALLLRALPAGTRQTIVDLAREEGSRLARQGAG